jgi:hypothetical protein
MKATVHTSATVRDITAMVKRVLKGTAAKDHQSTARSQEFLLKLGEEAASASTGSISENRFRNEGTS